MSAELVVTLTKDDLEELLNSKVDSFTISPLTAPGENYGSTMLLVEALLLPDHRKISVVAKMVSQFPQMREVFHFRETTLKEIYAYERVRPAFLAIQEEYKVPEDMFLDVIPRCYGARTSRGGGIDQPVDETSAILMENLKVSGYRLADRMVGLDMKHLEYVVTHLARFQATAVVIKIKKPDVFKDTVLKAATEYKKKHLPASKGEGPPIQLLNALSDLPVVLQYRDKIKVTMEKDSGSLQKAEASAAREPFATLVHNDFWTNNMMFSYDAINRNNITGLKIFDFQRTSYASPVRDLLFLLYSSRAVDVTMKNCDALIKLYHDEFTKWLDLFDCSTEPFSYDSFMKEVDIEGPLCFTHAFVMLRMLSVPESEVPDLSAAPGMSRIFNDNSIFGDSYFKKVENLVNEFVHKKWI